MSDNNFAYNRGGLITFVFTMVFVSVFFIYIVVVHPGVDLGEKVQDPAGEAPVSAEAAFDLASVKEPWVDNEQVVAYGAKFYATNCAMCHGEKADGNGPAGAAMNPKPRNFVEGKWKLGGDSMALFKTISAGIPGTSMAGYAHLNAGDRWALVQFIRSVTGNKVADDAGKLKAFAETAK